MGATIHPIIVAYDGSAAAKRAIEVSADLLAGRETLIVTVWEPALAYAVPAMPANSTMMTPIDPEVAHEVGQALQQRAESVAHDGAAFASSCGLEAEPFAVPDEGDVASTLLELVRERQAAAIVVGSRGLTGLRARLEGSTSKGVLKHAACPVIVVHETNDAG